MRAHRVLMWLAIAVPGCVLGVGLAVRAARTPEARPRASVDVITTVPSPVTEQSPRLYELPPPPAPGLSPIRVGEPLSVDAALSAIEASKQVLGQVDRGAPCDALNDVTKADADSLPMLAFGHAIDGTCFILGWVDNVVLQTAAPTAGEDLIPFVYDDDGVALSSFPFPDEESIPPDFPLPPTLEELVRAG